MISITVQAANRPQEVVTIRRIDADEAYAMAVRVAAEFNRTGTSSVMFEAKVDPHGDQADYADIEATREMEVLPDDV